MMPLETVIIGFGGISAGLAADPLMARYFRYATHGQVLRDHPAYQWTAVVDPAEAARDSAVSEWGVAEAVPSVQALRAPERFRVAVLTNPAATRLECLLALPGLQAVMMEKPLGPDQAVVNALMAECQRRGLAVQVNFWRRGDTALRALAEGGLADAVGPVQAVFGLYGNGLFNNGSHLVDQIRLLLGPVVWVSAGAAPVPANGPIRGDVHIPCTLGLADGRLVQLQPLDFRHYREISLDIWGQRGRMQILHEGLTLLRSDRRPNRGLAGADEVASDETERLPIGVSEALYNLYGNLAEATQGAAALLSPMEEAVLCEKILDAVVQSAAADGRRVWL